MDLRQFVHELVVKKRHVMPRLIRPMRSDRSLPQLLLNRPNSGLGYRCAILTCSDKHPFERLKQDRSFEIVKVTPIRGGTDATIMVRLGEGDEKITLSGQEQWGLRWSILTPK